MIRMWHIIEFMFYSSNSSFAEFGIFLDPLKSKVCVRVLCDWCQVKIVSMTENAMDCKIDSSREKLPNDSQRWRNSENYTYLPLKKIMSKWKSNFFRCFLSDCHLDFSCYTTFPFLNQRIFFPEICLRPPWVCLQRDLPFILVFPHGQERDGVGSGRWDFASGVASYFLNSITLKH